ncbi:MAG: DUF5683 domain-containing protein [candidate division Zixibacteria bacterium]|nr:DUF5683 domain-containing protein [candidate division Zixibacteria bacterium]
MTWPIIIFVDLLLVFSASGVSAQDDSIYTDRIKISDTTTSDTVIFIPDEPEEGALKVDNPVDLETRLVQNPTKALFRSMLVPGLGQIKNRSYIKAGIIIGFETWFIASAIHYGRQASNFRKQYTAATSISQRNVLYGLYENRRDNSYKFRWFAGIAIFVSMFDAYVDAHLSGSPSMQENHKVDLSIFPDDAGGVNAMLTLTF